MKVEVWLRLLTVWKCCSAIVSRSFGICSWSGLTRLKAASSTRISAMPGIVLRAWAWCCFNLFNVSWFKLFWWLNNRRSTFARTLGGKGWALCWLWELAAPFTAGLAITISARTCNKDGDIWMYCYGWRNSKQSYEVECELNLPKLELW